MSDQPSRLLQLVEAEGGRLYGLLTRLTLREEVADDLLQELVVRLSQSEGFQNADDPFAYARRAAIHLAFDWRRQGRSRRRTEPLMEEPAAATPDLLAADGSRGVGSGAGDLGKFVPLEPQLPCAALHGATVVRGGCRTVGDNAPSGTSGLSQGDSSAPKTDGDPAERALAQGGFR